MPSCALCSFGATSDKFLKEHMMMKHDEREFSCEICDSTIRGKQKMQMHKKSHVEVYQKKGLGIATHQKRSQSGIVQFNVLHAGFAKKSDLQLRKPKKKPSSFVDICEI